MTETVHSACAQHGRFHHAAHLSSRTLRTSRLAAHVPSKHSGVLYELRSKGQQAVQAVAASAQQTNTEQHTTHKLTIDKSTQKPRVVILGSGWGAVSLLKQLPKHISNDYDIVVLSPRNYFLFTALLPQVASGNLEQHSIIESMRKIIGPKGRYFEAAVTHIDPVKQSLTANFPKHAGLEQYDFEVPYDILVYSVGSVVNTFGIQGVQEHTFFFKSIANANALRQRVCECFERAALPQTSQEERQKLLTFVVVGGGPTGVEVAAELYDLVKDDLRRFYPEIWKDARVCLVELQDHVLSTYDRKISDYTSQLFSRNGVELLINTKVESINADELTLKGKDGSRTVPYGACVWATVGTSSSGTYGRSIVTDEYLCVKGSKGTIFAMGDAATVEQPKALDRAKEMFDAADMDNDGLLSYGELAFAMQKASKEYSHLEEYSRYLDSKSNSRRFGGLVRRSLNGDDTKASQGLQQLSTDCKVNLGHFEDLLKEIDNTLRSLPATGQVAGQEGRYLAKLLSKHQIQAGQPLPPEAQPFRYSHGGDLAYVGSDKAVMQIPKFGLLRGFGAFLLWRGYETFRQISFRNKCLVAFDSLRSKVFGRDIEFGETDM